MNKSLLFFDIDGTIVNSFNGNKKISNRVQNALIDVKDKGHLIYVCTGRPFVFLQDYIKEFPFDGVICDNGAFSISKNQVYKLGEFKFDVLEDLFNFLESNNIINYAITSSNKICFYDINSPYAVSRTNMFETKEEDIVSKDELLKQGVSKIIAPINDELYNEIIGKYGEKIKIYKIHFDGYYEICISDATKGTAITELAKINNIDIKNTYCFGDGINDLPMFEIAHNKIAMGNACKELKEIATKVVDTVDNDGVAKYLENEF